MHHAYKSGVWPEAYLTKKKGFKGYVHAIRPDNCLDGTKAIPDGACVYT